MKRDVRKVIGLMDDRRTNRGVGRIGQPFFFDIVH